MGLEGINIVCETEELFGIEILDEEARQCLTPEALFHLVQAKLALSSDHQCITQRVFYRLRRAFLAHTPALAEDFRLASPLANLVSKETWPALWTDIRSRFGEPDWPATVPWPTRWFSLGDEPRTVRDLVWYVATSLPPPAASGQAWTPQTVELAIRRIVAQELGQLRGFPKGARFTALGVT